MMFIRKGSLADKEALFNLYLDVSKNQNGIARAPEEIDVTFIDDVFNNIIKKEGLLFLGEERTTEKVIAAIHAHKYGIGIFDHVLTHLTILVHPDYQQQGLGTELFQKFLGEIEKHRPDVKRVELESRASNKKALRVYQKLGFKHEGILYQKTRNINGSFEDSYVFAWENKNFLY
ncbi:GNAT family N-acetyltransferase [Pedobacter glucosidilyticus]|uniref:GNAT family N-acetyltransferase n=1 Tax=Pedobacter glucosidilyticus TaxID=1122941 RepID=UPI0026F022E7|nr:GNAT family N-acetyltransferase [Pedobacter glucosidilyticus]